MKICLARWQARDEHPNDPGMPLSWTAPVTGAESNCLDLRPLAEQVAIPSGLGGFGIFVSEAETDNGTVLSDDPHGIMSQAAKDALSANLGITTRALRLDDALYEMLVHDADVDGATAWKPIMPNTRGQLCLLTGAVDIKRPFEIGNPYWGVVQQALWKQYREKRIASDARKGPRNHHRRWLTAMMEKYKTGDHTLFIPSGETIVSPLPHASSFSDNFNRADEDLETSANWTYHSGGGTTPAARVTSNEVHHDTTTGAHTNFIYLNEQNTSTDDHECSIDQLKSSGNSYIHSMCRLHATNVTGYYCLNYTDGKNYFRKQVSGTITTFASPAGTQTVPETILIRADGSDIHTTTNGTDTQDTTDTAITGNTEGGLKARGQGGVSDEGDNWSLADYVAATGGRKNPLGYPIMGALGGSIG